MFPALFHKAEIDGFLVTHGGQRTAHRKRAALGFSAKFGGNGGQRRRVGQVVVTHHPRYFLNQIFFNLDIEAIGRRIHCNHAFCLTHWQTKA